MKKTNIFTVLVLFCSLFGFLSCTKHYADGDGGIKPSDDPVFIYDKEIIAGEPFFLSVSEVIENPIVRFDGAQMSLSVDESASQNGKSNIYIYRYLKITKGIIHLHSRADAVIRQLILLLILEQ